MLTGLSLKIGHNAFAETVIIQAPIIEGNDELAKEIREAYEESFKDVE